MKQRVLTVHHIDGDKANCRWWNLAALCQVCHLQVQATVRFDQMTLEIFEPPGWFRPHLAGYVAATEMDAPDALRETVIERMDDILGRT